MKNSVFALFAPVQLLLWGWMMQNAEVKQAACGNCGGSEFEWGWVHLRGLKQFLLFSQRDEGRWFGFIGRQVRCRRCVGCNQITFFCDSERCPLILWPRFSLRALLIGTTIVAIVCFLIALARGIR